MSNDDELNEIDRDDGNDVETVLVNGTFFYKNNKNDQIWWVEKFDALGEWEFSFDQKTIFNMFADYPWKLTPEQKAIFDRENPYWADFFKDRT